MSGRPKITWVIPSMGMGGTERQLLYLMEGLKDNFELNLVCTRRRGSYYDRAAPYCETVTCLNAASAWSPRLGLQLKNIFKRTRPDIVHSFQFGFDLHANRAARKAGVPVVVSSRRELPIWMKGRHRWMQRRANRYVDCIVANSRAAAEYAAKHEPAHPDLFEVIPNGIDASQFKARETPTAFRRYLGIPDVGPVVGMVANFSPVKDHGLFLKMAEHLIARVPHIHFLLVGSGAGEKNIRAAIAARQLTQHFTLVEAQENIAEYYNVMDVAVLTSKVEGLPNAVMESMVCGVPTVGAAVGGIPELIRDGETGRIITIRSQETFSDAVKALLEDSAAADSIAQQAKAWVQQARSMDKMVTTHRELYERLLSEKGVRD